MTEIISRDELREAISGATPPVLLEVLPRPYWRKHHLPGALSLPPDEVASIRELVPDTGTELVVYCWDDT
jgi:rhodanese-related sulfurtransferase